MARRLVLPILLLAAAHAQSAPFADPTRPPSGAAPVEAGGGAPGPRLESVLIAPDRRIAVINGQPVRVGGRFGEGQVIRITETEVTIRQGETTEVLKLYPDAERRARGGVEKRTAK